MPYYLNGELVTTHPEFVNEVNKYSTVPLLELIALICAKHATWDEWDEPITRNVTPWALAHITRTAAIQPERGSRFPRAEDIVRLCWYYLNIREPILIDQSDADPLLRLSIRLTHEQLPYQTHLGDDLARTVAILSNTDFPPERTPVYIRGDWDSVALGMPLINYMNLIHALWAFVLQNHGTFRPEWLSEEQHSFLGNYFDVEAATKAFESHSTIPINEFATVNSLLSQSVEEAYKKYEVNPLWIKPFVQLPDGRHVAPIAQLIVRKGSPSGIYYSIPRAHQQQFGTELGYLFETYIGNNLRLIPDATLVPEIAYKQGGNQGSCADWICVLPEVVLVVECKAIRPRSNMVVGSPLSSEFLREALQKGVTQVATTISRIEEAHAAFQGIPRDRPIFGFVVTLDRHWAFNVEAGALAFPDADPRTTVICAGELERLVLHQSPSLGDVLLERLRETGHALPLASTNQNHLVNPLLQRAEDLIMPTMPTTIPDA
ncbi:hypothetical protein [Pseudarthrobacter sulfonivorans]|uniref:hypothetical protein n=1 Tax=Pseudarthrobacter sulfonivorans TaxID=121292 RepID=UPI00277FCD6F|nr:hypothetical protein [Pseudarthrobacter sulfonivorans]MDQ0000465.1 hypothetical protein [Pseudarthrobacter sulfonivorans]